MVKVVKIIFLILIPFFLINVISAAAIEDTLHLNIQVINSTGDILTGTFTFGFNISTSSNCNQVVYTNSSSLTTDSRGIVSYYLENTNLNYSEQYWLCYYRNGVLINSSKIARDPYSFRARNISLSGVEPDSNFDMGVYNITTTGTGFFGFLGSLVSRITSLFVQNIDFTGNINGSGNITTTGRIGIGTETPSNTLDVRGTGNFSGILYYNNETPITALNETGLINSVNTTANIQNLLNSTGIYTYNHNQTIETFNLYNSTWDNNWVNQFAYNHTSSVFDLWGNWFYNMTTPAIDYIVNTYNSTWDNNWVNQFAYNHTSSTIGILGTNFTTLTNNLASVNTTLNIQNLYNSTLTQGLNSINTTANIQTLINGTNANFANVEFNGGWTNGGASVIGGNIFARAAYFYNITGLDVNTLKINGSLLPTTGWDNIFDIGSSSLRWRNLYIGGDARINGTIYYGNGGIPITALNETGLINSVNTTANIQALVNATYVPYNGANANVNLGIYNLTTTGNVGIGTTSPIGKLDVYGATPILYMRDSGGGGSRIGFMTANVDTEVAFIGYNRNIADALEFATGGASPTTKMIILSGGNVGIGTTSPTYQLHVNSTINYAAGEHFIAGFGLSDGSIAMGYYANGTTETYGYIRSRHSVDLGLGAGATDHLYIKQGGNIGIGTTSPGAKLEVNGAVTESQALVKFTTSGTGDYRRGIQLFNSGLAVTNELVMQIGKDDSAYDTGQIYFNYAGDASTSNRISLGLHSADDILNIVGTGNVGIGTTTPTSKLHVSAGTAGDAGLIVEADTDNNDEMDNPYIQFKQDGAIVNASIGLTGGDNIDSVGTTYTGGLTNGFLIASYHPSYPMQFGIGGAVRMTIDGSGNVGIGTTSPGVKLDVNGTSVIRGSGNYANNLGSADLQIGYGIATPTTSGSVSRLAIQPYGHTGGPFKFIARDTASNAYLDIDYGSTHGLTLDAAGNLGIGTTSPGYKLDVAGTIKSGLAVVNAANQPALRIASANTGSTGRIIALQQLTSEGDTRLFADYDPYVEYGIYIRNSDDSIHFTSGVSTNGLESWTEYSSSGSARTAYSKMKMSLGDGQVTIGGNVGIGTTAPLSKLSINGGLHVGGDSDAGDNNIVADGTISGTTITATTQFTGPGTGLTGTAASLSIGGNAGTVDNYHASELLWYNGWVTSPGYNADTIGGSKSGFSYSNNAAFTGPLVHFDAGGYGLQLSATYGAGDSIAFRTRNGDTASWNGWNTIWHVDNDGSGSGLDADLLDGISSAGFMRSDTNTGTSGYIDVGTNIYLRGDINTLNSAENSWNAFFVRNGGSPYITGVTYGGNTIWHAGNDGAGSGLDADLLDGLAPGSLSVNYAATAGTATSLNGGSVTAVGTNSFTFTHGQYNVLMMPAANNGGGGGDAGFYQWVSEPGVTWTGAGIARNMRNSASGFPRVNAGLTGQMIRFDEGTSIIFTTETAGGTRYTPLTLTSNDATVGGVMSATSFTGAGTGLTGTAASLSIGGSAGSVAVHSSNEINIGGSYAGGGRLYVNYGDGGSISEHAFYNGGTGLSGVVASYFTGAGTGLTGTAASLTAGAVACSGVTGNGVGCSDVYVNTGGDTMSGTLTMSGVGIDLRRSASSRSGINWYDPSYTSWSEYMCAAGATSCGPWGNINTPTGTLVTSWGLRSFIENVAGYGWTFESGTSSGQPTVVAEIRSSDGSAKFNGDLTVGGKIYNGRVLVTGASCAAACTSTASCPAGTYIMSGGCAVGDLHTNHIDDYPCSGTSWCCKADSGGGQAVQAYAICDRGSY